MISVSALCAYVRCPRQFFVHYVLKELLPAKDVIVLGLIKHAVCGKISVAEESLVCSLLPGVDVRAFFRTNFVRFLRDSVRSHSGSLRRVRVPLVDAFRACLPAVDFEVDARVDCVSGLLQRGLFGEDLWAELSPKVKAEYSVKSDEFGLSGRVDRLECYADCVVPVELKSGSAPKEGVWEPHRMQVACYMLLLSERFGVDVPRGVVHYVDSNARREVFFNPFMRDWVLETRDKCIALLASKEPPKGCGRCEYCSRNL